MTLAPARRQGRRFLNPDGTRAGQSFWRVPLLLLKRGPPWPPQAETPPAPLPPLGDDEVAITYIGHASFLIRAAGLSILTDPIWSARASPVSWWGPKRHRAPGLAFDDLPRIDAVLLSHGHYDHMDRATLRRLCARDRPLMLTGLGHAATLAGWGIGGAREMDWGQATELPTGGRAIFLPARHFSARGPHDHSRALWGGFALELKSGFRLCFLGDTAWGPHLQAIGDALGPFDVAMVPIGAYAPRCFMEVVHMTPEEAVRAHLALRARTSLAMHHGVFRLTAEPMEEPADRLLAARGSADFRLSAIGETIRFDSASDRPEL